MHIVIATERAEIVDLPAIQEIVRLGVDVEVCRLGPEASYDGLRDIMRSDTFGLIIDEPLIESAQYNYDSRLRLIISTEFDQSKNSGQHAFIKANVNAAYDDSRAELALGLALAHLRKIALNDGYVRAGEWTVKPSNQLSSLSVGIFSNSSVGGQVTRLFSAFSKTTGHYSCNKTRSTAGASNHDLICIIDDVGDEAISDAAFSSLRSGGSLVDVSRFPAFPQDRLEEWVDSGRLSGAATIVYTAIERCEKSSSKILFAPREVLRTAEAMEKARILASEEMLKAIRQRLSGN